MTQEELDKLRDWCMQYTQNPEKVLRMPFIDVAQVVINLSSCLIAIINNVNRDEQAIPPKSSVVKN